jgi:recombination protein RecR
MSFSPLINRLINALRCLPSVGPRSAQRIAFYLLERDREGGLALSEILKQALTDVKQCSSCRMLCETPLCLWCSSDRRDRTHLCIVETPADVIAIEQTGGYRGLYFVLMGHLSPLDGIGPNDLGIDHLLERLEQEPIKEVILATNPTVEGEATAHYIAGLIKQRGITTSRIAHGVPLGGELEFIDGNTLAKAFAGRVPLEA